MGSTFRQHTLLDRAVFPHTWVIVLAARGTLQLPSMNPMMRVTLLLLVMTSMLTMIVRSSNGDNDSNNDTEMSLRGLSLAPPILRGSGEASREEGRRVPRGREPPDADPETLRQDGGRVGRVVALGRTQHMRRSC